MDSQFPETLPTPIERLRERFGRRALGIIAALLFEVLLILLLLSLGRGSVAPAGRESAVATFDVSAPPAAEPDAQDEPDKPQPERPQTRATPVPEMPPPAIIIPRPATIPPPQPQPQPTPVPIVPMTKDELDSTDLANTAPRPSRPMQGPTLGPGARVSSGDSEVVGKAPDGSPLYAARWYREPTDQELNGYLSTASGPGWALIACKTAPQWRVEDCVGLDESPPGSQLLRSVLAAAWQFQVRPARKNGQSLVGSWVRIRIEYTIR